MESWRVTVDQVRANVGAHVVALGADIAQRGHAAGNGEPGSAQALLRPTSTEELAAILQVCHANHQPVVPQGGLTGLVKGATAPEGTLALSLDRMRAIEEVDVLNRTLTAQAGVVLQVAQERAAREGLFLGVDLGARGSATLGGNVATNAGGNRVIRWGMMRENVLGLEVVLADGTILSSLRKVLKDNAGTDWKQLFIGTEGTLGVVSRVVLRLRRQPATQTTALLALDDFESLVALLAHVDAALGGALCAFEVMWRDYYELVTSGPKGHRAPLPHGHRYYALVEAMGGDAAGDRSRFEQTLIRAHEMGIVADAAVAKDGADTEAFWALREDVLQMIRLGPFIPFDVSLDLREVEDYVARIDQRLRERWPGARLMVFGHLGDGNIHLFPAVGAGDDATRCAVAEIVYGELPAGRSSISAEHGIGVEKKPYLSWCRSETELGLMRALKSALDPRNILNPGKVV